MTLLQQALDLANRGWRVFPLLPGEKHPTNPDGFKIGTIDHKRITGWWTSRPDSNVGIWLGASDLVVLDVDGGVWTEEDAEAIVGALPPTYVVRTGRRRDYDKTERPVWGGLQIYYRGSLPSPTSYETSIAGRRVDGEVRGGACLVVAAGSIHPKSKEPYTVFRDLPIAPVPAEVLALARQQRSSKRIDPTQQKVRSPHRHEFLKDCAIVLFSNARLFGDVLYRVMLWENKTYCDPPKDPVEVKRICLWVEANVVRGLRVDDVRLLERLRVENPKLHAVWSGDMSMFDGRPDERAAQALEYLTQGLEAEGCKDWEVERIIKASPLRQALEQMSINVTFNGDTEEDTEESADDVEF